MGSLPEAGSENGGGGTNGTLAGGTATSSGGDGGASRPDGIGGATTGGGTPSTGGAGGATSSGGGSLSGGGSPTGGTPSTGGAAGSIATGGSGGATTNGGTLSNAGAGGNATDCLAADPPGTGGYAGGACDILYPECEYGGVASATCGWLMYHARHSVFEWVRTCLADTEDLCGALETEKVRSCVNRSMSLVCLADDEAVEPGDVTCGDVTALCPEVTEAACLQAVSILGDDDRTQAFHCFAAAPLDAASCAADFYGCTGRPEVFGIPGEIVTLQCPDQMPDGACNRNMPECEYGNTICICMPMGPDLDAPAEWRCMTP